jgi:hypothetical protein
MIDLACTSTAKRPRPRLLSVHGVGDDPRGTEIDVAISYADFCGLKGIGPPRRRRTI